MEKKNINGQDYIEVDIQSIQINGISRDNKFDISDIDDSHRIFFDIKVSEDLSTSSYSTLSTQTENLLSPKICNISNKRSKLYISIGLGLTVLASIFYIIFK